MDRFIDGRTAVFIDGPNTYYATKSLGFDMDYSRLLKWLRDRFDPVLRVSYYTTVDENTSAKQSIKPLIDFLDYNGYTVVTKPVRSYDNEDSRRFRGDVAVDIA